MSPWTPPHPCAESGRGCPALVPQGKARSPEHERAQKQAYRQSRPPALTKFYGSSRWKLFREHQRASRPVCECADPRCHHMRWGPVCMQPTSVIDHIEEPLKRPDEALAAENTQALCASCHSSKTARLQSWHRG